MSFQPPFPPMQGGPVGQAPPHQQQYYQGPPNAQNFGPPGGLNKQPDFPSGSSGPPQFQAQPGGYPPPQNGGYTQAQNGVTLPPMGAQGGALPPPQQQYSQGPATNGFNTQSGYAQNTQTPVQSQPQYGHPAQSAYPQPGQQAATTPGPTQTISPPTGPGGFPQGPAPPPQQQQQQQQQQRQQQPPQAPSQPFPPGPPVPTATSTPSYPQTPQVANQPPGQQYQQHQQRPAAPGFPASGPLSGSSAPAFPGVPGAPPSGALPPQQQPFSQGPAQQGQGAPLPPPGMGPRPAGHGNPGFSSGASPQPGFPPAPGAPAPQGFAPAPGGPPQQGFPPAPGQQGFPSLPGPQGYPQGPPGAFAPPGGPTQPGFAPPGGPPQAGFPPSQPNFGGPPGPGGFPAGGPGPYPAGPGAQQQRQRLDPNMMPSAVQVMEDDATTRSGLFPTGYPHAEPPPLVSTNYFAQDQGNCNPKYIRSTLYVAPQSNDILKSTQIPFAVGISPFAPLHPKEIAPPIIDLGPGGPVRCQRCKAYICPFMEFQDGGRRFKCPFCNAGTPVEDVYFAHLDHTGRRTDIEHRPELFLGAYEFIATKQYCKNGVSPKEPAFIFMIDVSYNAIGNGMVQLLCNNLERILHSLPKELNLPESAIRVGLAAFDQSVHFFDLSSAQPRMLVVGTGDVSDMFVPIVDGLLLPYSEAATSIRAVLAEIPRLFAQTSITETMLGPVVQAGIDALKCADRAGKLFIFNTSLPTMEAPGKLKVKNDRPLLGTDKEKTALIPQDDFYTKLGEKCVKSGVTVDLFLFPNSFIDVASIGQLSAVSGGSVYKYQYFVADKDATRFLSDLHHDVCRQIAFDCMVRVRSSAGIRPVTFHGSFFMENTTDLEMSSIDEDKAFFVELKHDDKLSDPSAIVQCAILFTSVSGQRRLRILNLCLPVSSDYNQLYRVADQDTLTTFLLKNAVQLSRDKGNKDMKEALAQRTAQMLSAYREKVSENAPLGQLILPETLKLMPLYVNSIMKNDAVSGGSEMTVDDKTWMIELIRGMRIEDAVRILYPRVYAVHDLELNEGTESFGLPNAVRASIEYMQTDKAYLIDNGVVLFLWVGLAISDAWLNDIFGVQSITQVDSEAHVIPEKDNARSRGLRRAVQLIHGDGGLRRRKLFVILERGTLEPWMKKFLVEDKSGPNVMSYVDFLCHIHREIRNILS